MSPADLTPEQRDAVIEGRIHDCPYNHQDGTRCPNCSGWPFAKGGAAEFLATMRAQIEADERKVDDALDENPCAYGHCCCGSEICCDCGEEME